MSEFPTPTAAVVKHATPCGVASGATVREALERAIATDPVARYGCVIAVNRPVEADAPEALKGVYVDLLGAPAFDPAAEAALSRRSKMKLVRVDPPAIDRPRWEAHSATGRLLLQETDRRQLVPSEFRLVTGQGAGDSPRGVRPRLRLAGRAPREIERDRPRRRLQDRGDRRTVRRRE